MQLQKNQNCIRKTKESGYKITKIPKRMSRLETHPMILLEAPPSNHPVYACPLSILPPDQFQYRAQLTIKYHIQTAAPITYVQGGCHPDPLKCERSQRVDLD